MLRRLDFGVEVKGDAVKTVAPPYREDVEGYPDLAEEVIRVYGYEHIVPTLLKDASITDGGYDKEQKDENRLKRVLAAGGFSEIMTYSFYSKKDIAALGLNDGDKEGNVIVLEHPLSDNYEVLRYSMIPSFLGVISRNIKRGTDAGRIFEIARTFSPKELPLTEFPEEHKRLAVAVFGDKESFFTLKGAIERISDYFGVKFDLTKRAEKTYLHPGVSAKIIVGGEEIGCFGQVRYEVAAEYDIERNVYVAELDYTRLAAEFDKPFRFTPLPKFPHAERDLAFVCDEKLTCDEIAVAIKQAAKGAVEEVSLFDVYTGEQVENGKKSMAYKVVFRAGEDKPLTAEDVDALVKRILGSLKHRLNVELR